MDRLSKVINSEYAKKKGFNHHRIIPRHPRANGECERFMRNLKKSIRTVEQEKSDYKEKIAGMLEAYRATPHPSTSKSPYELMFGRKINLNIFPSMKRSVRDSEIRNHHRRCKESSKKYHDKKKNVKRSCVRLGDRVLMKDMRTDCLRPEVGIVVATTEHSVTVKFADGRIFKRDKSHIKVVNKAVIPLSQKLEEKNVKKPKRYVETDESEEEDSDQETVVRTRSGREVKRPERLGEWIE